MYLFLKRVYRRALAHVRRHQRSNRACTRTRSAPSLPQTPRHTPPLPAPHLRPLQNSPRCDMRPLYLLQSSRRRTPAIGPPLPVSIFLHERYLHPLTVCSDSLTVPHSPSCWNSIRQHPSPRQSARRAFAFSIPPACAWCSRPPSAYS